MSVLQDHPYSWETGKENKKEFRSVIAGMAKQAVLGMDMTKIVLPTCVLERRSLLEKWADFLHHPLDLFLATRTDDPQEQMGHIIAWFVSNFCFLPKSGLKKPYNPILGEQFHCIFDPKDGKFDGKHPSTGEKYDPSTLPRVRYIAEQVSHHPPVSAFVMIPEDSSFKLDAWLYTRSKLVMNAAASLLEGRAVITIGNRHYYLTLPAPYFRGIMVGDVFPEMCGVSNIFCPETNLWTHLDFKHKGKIFGRSSLGRVTGSIYEFNTKDASELHSKKPRNFPSTFNGYLAKLVETEEPSPSQPEQEGSADGSSPEVDEVESENPEMSASEDADAIPDKFNDDDSPSLAKKRKELCRYRTRACRASKKLRRVSTKLASINGNIFDSFTINKTSDKWTALTGSITNVNTVPILYRRVLPLEQQKPCDSHVVWKDLTTALQNPDIKEDERQTLATSAKTSVEQEQRDLRKERAENNDTWQPVLFEDDPVSYGWRYHGTPVFTEL